MRSIDKKVKLAELKQELGSPTSTKVVFNFHIEHLQAMQYYMDQHDCSETQAARDLVLHGFHATVNTAK